jgi:hypothetical protein
MNKTIVSRDCPSTGLSFVCIVREKLLHVLAVQNVAFLLKTSAVNADHEIRVLSRAFAAKPFYLRPSSQSAAWFVVT